MTSNLLFDAKWLFLETFFTTSKSGSLTTKRWNVLGMFFPLHIKRGKCFKCVTTRHNAKHFCKALTHFWYILNNLTCECARKDYKERLSRWWKYQTKIHINQIYKPLYIWWLSLYNKTLLLYKIELYIQLTCWMANCLIWVCCPRHKNGVSVNETKC